MRLHSAFFLSAVAVFPQCAHAGIMYVVSNELSSIFRYDAETGRALRPIHAGDWAGVFVDSISGLYSPHDLALGPNGDVFVSSGDGFSNLGNGVFRYNKTTGDRMLVIGANTIQFPQGIAFGPDGMLYVNSRQTNTIQRYNPDSGEYLGDFATPYRPVSGIAFGPDGNLYATDQYSVERFNGRTGDWMDFFTSGHNMQYVFSPTFGPDGDLYVLDQYDEDVVRFDGVTGGFKAVFIDGQYLFNPSSGMAFGPNGDLFTTNYVNGNTPGSDGIDRFDGRTGRKLGGFITTGVPHGSYVSTGIAFDQPAKVPEPSTMHLIAFGVAAYLAIPHGRSASP